MTKQRRTHLVMAGYELQGSENLSLRLIAGAARHAGFTVSVCTAGASSLAPGVLRDALTSEPTVLGFVLQDPHNALHSLALAELARKMGFKGYIVCAGEFAALQSGLILERAPSVDGVIRHSGGTSMTELLSAIENGFDLSRVSCLHTRKFETPPGMKTVEPFRLPVRGERPTVMGIPIAEVIAGKGCDAGCEYCTHAAVEAMSSGGRKAGTDGPVRRDMRELADEMATLYHDKGVRHFGFSDESIVPRCEQSALDWAGSFKEALVARNMVEVSLGFMTRADAVTEKVADALVNLGLIRTLVGVESGNSYGLASLGRRGNAEKGRRGLKLLVERKVVTLFNDIIFHPETTVESLQNEIQFLKGVSGALFDTVQAVPFIGTALCHRMTDEGRLTGGRILPTFIMDDPALRRFRSLLTRLQTQAFGPYNPTLRAHDLLFSAALAVRHGNHNRRASEIADELEVVAGHINTARVDTLEELLNAALQGNSADAVIDAAGERFGAITRRLDNAAALLKSSRGRIEESTRHGYPNQGGLFLSKTYRNFAAAATIVFMISGTTGCRHAALTSNETDEDTQSGTEPADGTETMGNTGTIGDTVTIEDTETVGDTTIADGTESEYDSASNDCTDSEHTEEYQQVTNLVYGNCHTAVGADSLRITIGPDGKVQSVIASGTSEDNPMGAELIHCVEDLLKGEKFPCLENEEVWVSLPPIKVIA